MEWLLLLGAGASIASPTRLPAFEPMRDEILAALGWKRDEGSEEIYEHRMPLGGLSLPPLRSRRLSTRSAPPEVVFGTLHRFGIPFAEQLEQKLLTWEPSFNAVHVVAATALGLGWPVWTPNVDVAVERASKWLGAPRPPRLIVGERDRQGERLPVDVGVVDASTYVKFHGSVDAPGSLAFTDLELLAPYPDEETRRLAALARNRTIVVYGYAGADADLRDLFVAAMREASEVRWYEPRKAVRERIERTFDGLFRFDPERLPGDGEDFDANVAATASTFLTLASDASLLEATPPELRDDLMVAQRPASVGFTFDPPGIVHARLVERFGRTEDEDVALRAARRADLLRLRPRAVRGHVKWTLSRSLYREGGIVRRVAGAAARHPMALRHVPAPVANYVYDKGPAVLLPNGEYEALHALASQAITVPSRDASLQRGSDLYYQGHSLRYMNEPERARSVLTDAKRLLADRRGRSDAERYAGVLLELGIIAIYQGRITDAFAAADELVNGPGRYAIGRWSGWGNWLWAMAHLYSTAASTVAPSIDDAVSAAHDRINDAEADFDDSDLARGDGDIFIVRLLAHRLRLAARHDEPTPVPPPNLTRRQSHDVALLQTDIALAKDDLAEANRHLTSVEGSPANQVAAAWARLGRTEYARRAGTTGSPHADIEQAASEVGAWWLAAQARLGTQSAAEVTIDTAPWPVRARAVGSPRVLWLLT
jgi:hypothetical protein